MCKLNRKERMRTKMGMVERITRWSGIVIIPLLGG